METSLLTAITVANLVIMAKLILDITKLKAVQAFLVEALKVLVENNNKLALLVADLSDSEVTVREVSADGIQEQEHG